MYINKNIYNELDDCYELKIICKDNIYSTYFDKFLYDRLKAYHWRLSRKKQKLYVCTGQNKDGNKIIYMSNLIMDFIPNKEQEVDHIDGNSLNNKMNNLRLINRIDNIHNSVVRVDNKSTGIRGISIDKRNGLFKFDFYYNKKRLQTKDFKVLEEAVYARYLCEKILLKDFRNESDDIYKKSLIESIDNDKKQEIEEYINKKLKERGFID